MLSIAVAAAVLGLGQTPPPVPQTDPGVRVEDVVVEGRRLEDAADDFVGEVAAPVNNRGLARWHRGVCVGVVNLQTDVAQYMADRVSTVATDLGLTAGEPGCKPNIVVIATDDGEQMAKELVASRRRDFRTGASGTDRGMSALRDFQTVSRPVRWWHVSLPVDSETGRAAVRLPGYVNGDGGSVTDYAPQIAVFAASRVISQIRDDLRQAVIIVDLDDVGDASYEQLSDYVAMVALAQIDPEAQTQGYNSILNLFADGETPSASLTEWDMAYLTGLYQSEQNRVNLGSQATAVASAMARDRRATSDEAAQ